MKVPVTKKLQRGGSNSKATSARQRLVDELCAAYGESPERVAKFLDLQELQFEEVSRCADLVGAAGQDARARFIEAERQRPRRGRAPLPAGLKETRLGRSLVLVEGPAQHVRVPPDRARDAEALRALFDLQNGDVLPEIVQAIEAAKEKAADLWVSSLIYWLTLAVAEREQRRRHPDVPVVPLRPVQWWIGADLRPPPFGGLSVAPRWLTASVVDWLLAHFAPTRAGSKGGGRGKLNEATIRRLLKNRHELAKKIEPSDRELAAHVQAGN